MKKKVLLLILCLALISSILVGCNNMKQDGVETDLTNKTITANGGLAVGFGNYIYFVNGRSAQTADNQFGEVTKGAIARLELDAEGVIIENSIQIIVPKVVFGTNANSGLTIQGDYIYYTTTSTKKDSQGEPKTGSMVLMRSTLDGSLTQIIKEFDDFKSQYRVTDGYIIYDIINEDEEKELRSIDLSSKKFKDELIATDIVGAFYLTNDQQNTLSNYVFYTKEAEDENDYHNIVYVANGSNDVNKAVFDKDTYTDLVHPAGYRITLLDFMFLDDNQIRLIYNKTDRGVNTTSKGTYSSVFDSNFDFNQANEVRYSSGAEYTKLRFLTEKYVLASRQDKIEFLTLDNSGANTTITREVAMSFVPTIYKTEVVDDALYLIYVKDNKFYRIKMFDIALGVYTLAFENAVLLYDKGINQDWLKPEIIGDYLFFFNSEVVNNAYALRLSTIEPRNADSRIAQLIGIMTPEDEIEATGSAPAAQQDGLE